MFGEFLKYLRKCEDLNQSELAKILYVNSNTISLYETDKIIPDGDILIRIGEYFNIPLNYLFQLCENQNESKKNDNTEVILSDDTEKHFKINGSLKMKIDALSKLSDRLQNIKKKKSSLNLNELLKESSYVTEDYIETYEMASTMNFIIDGKYTNLTNAEVQLLISNLETMGFDIHKMIKKFKKDIDA